MMRLRLGELGKIAGDAVVRALALEAGTIECESPLRYYCVPISNTLDLSVLQNPPL